MDCVQGLKLLQDNSVDLIVTSPPYNCGIEYDSWKDCMPWDKYLQWCEEWLSECYRVLKDDGRICINHYIQFTPKDYDADGNWEHSQQRFPLFDFRTIMEKIGYTISKLCIWDDNTLSKFTAWGSYMSQSQPSIYTPYEGILIGYKKQWKKLQQGKSTMDRETFIEGVSGVWHLGTVTGDTMQCFPEKLPYMCIQLLTYEGDTVLDPFSGSGTTAFVQKNTNRKYIGFEISENYYNCSIQRLNGNKALCIPKNKDESYDQFKKFDLFDEI